MRFTDVKTAPQSRTLEQLIAQAAFECALMIEYIETYYHYRRTVMDGPQSLSTPDQRYTRHTVLYRGVDMDSSKLAVRGKSEGSWKGVSKRRLLACLALPVSQRLGFAWEITRTSHLFARGITRANHPLAREIHRANYPLIWQISRASHPLFSKYRSL